MSGPFVNTMKTISKYRYVVLAGTMLSALALPQWSSAIDASYGARKGAIVVAEAADPGDPNNKGKQPPAKAAVPPKGQPGAQGQPGGVGQPPGQQRQLNNQPPVVNAPPQGQQGQPPGAPPGLQKQIGKQAPVIQQAPGGIQQVPGGQPPINQQGAPKQGQPNQFGKQAPVVPQDPAGQRGINQQGVPKQGQPNQFGKQAPGGIQQVPGGQPPINQPGAPKQGQPNQFGKQAPVIQQDPAGQRGINQPGGVQPSQPKQFGKQVPANPQGGLAGQGVVNIDQLRARRVERKDAAGRVVIQEPGNRQIVRDGGRTFIRNDDGERFRRFSPTAQVSKQGNYTTTSYRRGNYQIVNVTDANGRLIKRSRRDSGGREVILIGAGVVAGAVAASVFLNMAPPVVDLPRERYIVDIDGASPDVLYETLEAPPLVPLERAFSLEEVRYNVELRDRMRRVDINTINFSSGSWEVTPDQFDRLAEVAEVMMRVLSRKPDEIFLIEGHTDWIGGDDDNLSLSDRRADSVAFILTNNFQIPPENLVTQGYGKQYLKVPTQEANRENRRVAVRRIGPLLAGKAD
ncbi:MAG: hypothetical protein QOI12_4718 [Alphaproteobacteria bacterium]|nr:hypothetical protein [Alphaproteobacteria bacterium]